MSHQKYWLVKPEYYNKINIILGSNFTEYQINLYFKQYNTGIYISYDNKNKWGYMTYPDYIDYTDNNIIKQSKDWYNERGYVYKGELSRLAKLKRLNEL